LKSSVVHSLGADVKFGHGYRKAIAKIAIVGNKKWQEKMTALIDSLYAREAKFFPVDEQEAAWTWCRQPLS
jgi:SpoIIAA-like